MEAGRSAEDWRPGHRESETCTGDVRGDTIPANGRQIREQNGCPGRVQSSSEGGALVVERRFDMSIRAKSKTTLGPDGQSQLTSPFDWAQDDVGRVLFRVAP